MSKRVLAVEDQEDNMQILRDLLVSAGYEIIEAVNGEEALAAVARERPDLILMDLGLPGIDGWDATAHLKMDRETRHIPIIVLSAHAMPNDRHQALAAGGDDFDTKPVQFDRLLDKIETLLTRNDPSIM